jgi:hypothetical protein
MPLALNSPKVSASETEKKLTELLNEFLKRYFNGQPHVSPLTNQNVTFPLCDLFFNQAQLPSPADKPQIHVAYTDVRPEERWLTAEKKLVTTKCTLSIFVRAANQGAVGNTADFLCRKTADQVKEIFQTQDRSALAQKNIRHPKVLRGPYAVGTIGFQVRLLIVTCELQYTLPRTRS